MGIQVVAHLTQTLALRQQHHQPLDRRREGREVGAPGLRQQRHQLGPLPEMVALSLEHAFQPLQGAAFRYGQCRQGVLEFPSDLAEDCVEKPALGVIVVEQELLVDACSPGDGIHPRAIKAAPSEFLSRRGHNP